MTPIRELLCVHNAIFALAVGRTFPALVRFYQWFSSSGLSMARKRGFGQSACKAYGVVPAPKLSVYAMASSGLGLLSFLVAPLLPETVLPDIVCPATCVGALICYHLYFSQLFAEAHVGAHVTVLAPHMFVLLALAPAWHVVHGTTGSAADDAIASYFTLKMLQLVLTVAYCGAGVSKIVSSLRARRAWWDGATMQAVILEALYLSTPETRTSFGVPTPFSHALQRWAVRRPRLLAPASASAVAFELLSPCMLFVASGAVARAYAAVGLSFHYGIALLQNIDFISWWGAAYAPFLVAPTAAPCSVFEAAGVVFARAPLCAAASCAYASAHVIATAVLRFFPGTEILPFSSFGMFSNLVDVFDGGSRKWVWITEKPHETGTLKNYACGPFCRPEHVRGDELDKLPFRHVVVGCGMDRNNVPHAQWTNVDIAATPSLAEVIRLSKLRKSGF